MKKFLIEIPHEADKKACKRAIQIFLETGSHFLTNAEWGCMDDVHKAWIIVEAEGKDQAKFIIPPLYREKASIIELVHFTQKDLTEPEKSDLNNLFH